MGHRGDQLDGGFGLRICGLPDRGHRRVKDLAPLGDRCFPFPAELPDTVFALAVPSRHGIHELGLGARDGRRDARASVTSLMLVEAKPIPAVMANTNVTSQTAQPPRAVTRPGVILR
jgi:hypothetical protein